MTRPLEIVIVGGGTSGWMCAAAMAARLDAARVRVRLIESDEIGTVGVGEATLPQMKDFNDFVGIDEVEFMRATQATFKLGIEFVDWGRKGDRYIHPFGTFGKPIGDAEFFQYWTRGHRADTAAALFDYCLPIVAATAHRFTLPERGRTDVRNAFSYAYHIDAGLYARYLRGWSEARGLERIEGKIVAVAQRDDGGVASVTLASGATVSGDLFVDCSGFRALLIGETLGSVWESWAHWLPCDRAVAVPCDRSEDLHPYTRLTAREAGWQWRIPLQHRTGNGYVFSSRYISEERATETLMANLDGAAQAAPRVLRFEAGKRRTSWSHNVVAIGLAGGFLEPLESTSIYLVQMGIAFLLTLVPDGPGIDPALRDEFNRQIDVEYARIRDFLVLHYHANQRGPDEGDLWRHCREMTLPDTLQAKIDRFRHRGHVLAYRDGLFGPPSWQAVFVGQNIVPEGYDRLASRMPDAMLHARMAALHGEIADTVQAMPSHADFVARYCASIDEARGMAPAPRP